MPSPMEVLVNCVASPWQTVVALKLAVGGVSTVTVLVMECEQWPLPVDTVRVTL